MKSQPEDTVRTAHRLLSGLLFLVFLVVVSSCKTQKGWQENYNLGLRFLQEENYEEAVLSFTAAIEIDSKNSEAFAGRAEAYTGIARRTVANIEDPSLLPEAAVEAFENAIQDYLKSIEINPVEPEYYKSITEIYLTLGRKEDAIDILERGVGETNDPDLVALLEELQSPDSDLDTDLDIDEEEILTSYLNNGGWEEIIGEPLTQYYDLDNTEISGALADIDEDGIREYLVSVAFLDHSGPGGNETFYALLDIRENGSVEISKSTYYGGGTDGGDELRFLYNSQEQKYVLAVISEILDGYSTGSTLEIYTSTLELALTLDSHYYSLEGLDTEYYEDIEQIRRETNLFSEDEDGIYTYKLNNSYVSEDEYNAISSRFTEPTDPAYTLQQVTAADPIPEN